MQKTHFIFSLIFLISVFYVILEVSGFPLEAYYLRALIVPSMCIFYISRYKMQLPYFSVFLILFSISDLLTFFDDFLSYNLEYYLGNILYVLGYLVLMFGVLRQLNLKEIMSRFKFTILIVVVLNLCVLFTIYANDFSELNAGVETNMVSNLLEFNSGSGSLLAEKLSSIILELVYNSVILVLLTVSFINFLYRDNNRSLFLFIGSLCIVFSEVIQYAIIYPSEEEVVLNLVCYILLVAGFIYFYLYAIQSDIETLDAV